MIYIKNAWILTQVSPETWIYGGVLIQGQEIKEVISYEIVPDGLESSTVDQTFDAKGMLLVPGQVNSHYHSYANLLKGTTNNLPLELWSLFTVAYGHSLSNEDIRHAVLLGAAEMLKNGISGAVDHFPHLPRVEVALSAYEESGMRVGLAPMLHDIPDYQSYPVRFTESVRNKLEKNTPRSVSEMQSFFRRLLEEWHGKDNRLKIILGPNAPHRCSLEFLQLCSNLSDQAGIPIHMHLFETRLQKLMGQELLGDVLAKLDELNLLHDRFSVAHAIWLTDREVELLAKRRVNVVHNPMSNLTLGSGQAPLVKYLMHGISVGLGTDASNCGGPINLFEIMRLATTLHRLNEPDYRRWPQASDAWKMGTEGGAAVLGMSGLLGKIESGYRADLVLLQRDSLFINRDMSKLNQIVFHQTGASVDSVMINGKWVMQSRKILTFDEEDVLNKVLERQEELLNQCNEPLNFAKEQLISWQNMYHNYYIKD